ncbi:metalloregulator ArsR/SmtB family transcription factor [Plantactinospora endophytica]|uniref:Regulatory protein, ArsR family n=1 Tax=Plantactinospora endophytica TaxID=673535 RepID=A0ABQ4E7P9_9ACTN|nr:metalloregulator ArsR/SmtB family transcription factor [Plantactinospora endophytica]GIG90679.1 putative regulatory protein, ArsR family [Plantactinospora endophytica]
MKLEQSALRRRARIHAALGDPARLAIVDALTVGDASPGELARALDLPSNLLAHHLKTLQGAGLVTRTRSEGDGRRTYLRLEADVLATLVSPQLPDAGRILFVCTHNSARSQLAAALWARRARIPAASAGTIPAPRVHPRAIRVARRHGLTIPPTATAHIDDVITKGDLVVAVCDRAHEELADTPGPRLHWSVPDPSTADSDSAFEAAYTDLADRIDRLAPALRQETRDA